MASTLEDEVTKINTNADTDSTSNPDMAGPSTMALNDTGSRPRILADDGVVAAMNKAVNEAAYLDNEDCGGVFVTTTDTVVDDAADLGVGNDDDRMVTTNAVGNETVGLDTGKDDGVMGTAGTVVSDDVGLENGHADGVAVETSTVADDAVDLDTGKDGVVMATTGTVIKTAGLGSDNDGGVITTAGLGNDNDVADSEEDSDDKYRVEADEAKPRKITRRRIEDQAAWDDYFRKHAGEIVSDTMRVRAAARVGPTPPMTLQGQGVTEQQKKIIGSAREYQIELFERCKLRNTIAVLPTGTGKTLVAAMLLRWTLEQELESRQAGNTKKMAFFLVDKVALVNQQHNFLQNNLDYPIGQYCGDTSDAIWNPGSWDEIREKYMVIVCTAAILHKALQHSFTRIRDLSLIIFDEAHHAKKDHMYARIIKDFYIRERDRGLRPRIMGMTASPVDGKEDIKWATERLETCLNCDVATVSIEALQRGLGSSGQNEYVNYYKALAPVDMTPLYEAVQDRVRRLDQFRSMLTFARSATKELGPWPSDRFWHLKLNRDALKILEARCERDVATTYEQFSEVADPAPVVKGVTVALDKYPLPSVQRTNEHLSTKVLHLLDLLERSFTVNGVSRCIVFVEMRNTAMMLFDLLAQPELKVANLHAATLMGNPGSGDANPMSSTSMAGQRRTLIKFRNGEYNCLIATSVAEEGIDIPQCDLVIRFDLYHSMIQYVQSKGRARHKFSTFINMAEAGNREHERRIKEAQHSAKRLGQFCSVLSDEQRVDVDKDDDDVVDGVLAGEIHYKQLQIEETGARLTFLQSLGLLSTFVSSLNSGNDISLTPEYMVTPYKGVEAGSSYMAEVLLPEKAPIRSAMGQPQRSKKAAKCSAAFEMCRQLIAKNHIDKYLRPVFVDRLPKMRNARLAVSDNIKKQYDMNIKPGIWTELGRPDQLYGSIILLESPAAVGRPSCPIVLLTRAPLPSLPAFPLFFGKVDSSHREGESSVRIMALSSEEILKVTDQVTEDLRTFTLRMFADVFSKWFDATAAELPYFVAPSNLEHTVVFEDAKFCLRDIIKWDDVEAVKQGEFIGTSLEEPDGFFANRFIVDLYDGSRKFFSRRVDHAMTPNSPLPEWVVPPKVRRWKDLDHTPLEYSNTKWNRTRQVKAWNPQQRVIECEIVSHRRNLLDEHQEDMPDPTCWVIMEPLRISALRTEFVAMALAFPAIMYRLESCLIALDACKMVGLDIRPDLALEAMTKDSDNSGEDGQEQINLQAGMGANYERLEFLGDTVLKMATSISTFTNLPDAREFEFHVERMLLLCNKNLLNGAVDRGLPAYIRTCQFNRTSWYPQGLRLVKGRQVKAKLQHHLAEKTIADVCEALIGAAYLTYADGGGEDQERDPFDQAVKAVSVFVRSKNHKQASWKDYYPLFKAPKWQQGPYSAAHIELARQLKESAGYEFVSPSLARSAFKHASYPYDTVPHYERLEFLGDALLDMACVDFLFRKYPGADPQWLTEHKEAMVSNEFLSCLGVKLGFHRHILTTSSALLGQVGDYVNELEAACETVDAETQDDPDGSSNDGKEVSSGSNARYWYGIKNVPKAIADVVEAYLGAMFVDSCYNYATINAFFDAHVRPFFEDMTLHDLYTRKHPVRAVSHMLSVEMGCSRWRFMASECPPSVEEAGAAVMTESQVVCGLLIHRKVIESAMAASGRYAKQAAAAKALRKLEVISKEEFGVMFGCDCCGVE